MTRILIDMDSVLYNIHTPWLALHNDDYPDHIVTSDSYDNWDMQKVCDDAGCEADIYGYLNNKHVWNAGNIIEGAYDITLQWGELGYDLGVVTAVGNTIAANRKLSWLNTNLPHLRNVIISYGRNKHWITGDFLIDDGEHNLEHFSGISILFAQPWNRYNTLELPRVRDWEHLDAVITRGEYLLNTNTTFRYMKDNIHKIIQNVLYKEIEDGIL